MHHDQLGLRIDEKVLAIDPQQNEHPSSPRQNPDLVSGSPSRAPHILMIVVRDAGSVLVYAEDRCIDHLHRRILTTADVLRSRSSGSLLVSRYAEVHLSFSYNAAVTSISKTYVQRLARRLLFLILRNLPSRNAKRSRPETSATRSTSCWSSRCPLGWASFWWPWVMRTALRSTEMIFDYSLAALVAAGLLVYL